MVTKLLWGLINVVPMVLGASLVATLPAYASEEVDSQPLAHPFTSVEVEAGDRLEGVQTDGYLLFNQESIDEATGSADELIIGQSAADTTDELIIEESTKPNDELIIDESTTDESTGSANELIIGESAEPDDELIIDESRDETTNEPIINEPSNEPSNEVMDETDLVNEDSSPSPQWRFTFAPYVYIPLHVNGEIGVDDISARFGEDTDIERTIDVDTNIANVIDTIRDTDFFGFMGRAEAWRGNLGLILDGSYLSVGQDNTTTLDPPDRLEDIIPSEVEVESDFSYGQFDLGAGYRFADASRLAEAETDFDLGPIVFDVIAGARLYTIDFGIDVSTNLGSERERGSNSTIITPLLSSRLRWNLSRNFALGVRGDLAGFGVGGLDFAWSVTGDLDWMFSGNTSVALGYRFAGFDYSKEVNGRDRNIDLTLNGPYLNVTFRF